MGLAEICHGVLVGKDFFGVNERMITSPDLLRSLKYVLVDLERVESIGLTMPEIQRVARQDKRMVALLPDTITLAIAAPRDILYGIARMWEAFAAGTGWEVMVFRTKTDAVSWIQQRMKERFDIDLPVDSDAV